MEILEKNENYVIKKIPGLKGEFFYICEILNFKFYEKLKKEILFHFTFIRNIKKVKNKIYILYHFDKRKGRGKKTRYFYEGNEVSHIFFNEEIEKICKKNIKK